MRTRKLTDAEIRLARRWHSEGRDYYDLAAMFGASRHIVRMAIDAEYAERRKTLTTKNNRKRPPEPRVVRPQEIAIPRDTRGFTARICGDPLPGRSALDMRGR